MRFASAPKPDSEPQIQAMPATVHRFLATFASPESEGFQPFPERTLMSLIKPIALSLLIVASPGMSIGQEKGGEAVELR